MKLNVVKNKKIWFSISALMMALSIIFLSVWGLKLGIDFTGGSLLQVVYTESRPELTEIQNALEPIRLDSLKVQPSDELGYILRFEDISSDTHKEIIGTLEQAGSEIENNELVEERFESIGPVIGSELRAKAITAIIVVLVFIVIYIAWAFRSVSKPVASWKYGMSAIIALFHDILIVTGVFSALGQFLNVEVDTLFVTALLTILGFSVHDTIVTFDRTRENLAKNKDNKFDEVVEESVDQTLIRSINTSVTTLFVLLAIFFFGGESIKYFVLALIIGVAIGTYSSIFLASPLLTVWKRKKA